MTMNDAKTMTDYQLAERLRAMAIDHARMAGARGPLDDYDNNIISILYVAAERLEKAAGL
jgi:hypothetical protein